MFRLKIGIVYSVVVVVSSAAALFWITAPVRKTARQQVDGQVARAARLCDNRLRLDAADVRRIVDTLAHESEFVNLLTQVPEADRRKTAFVAVEGYSERIRHMLGQKADFIAVLDANGKVLARDLDPSALFGEDFRAQFPGVAQALAGKPIKDIWNYQGKMHRVGVAPVRAADGTIAGALVVAYVVTAKDARSDRADFGTEVAYFLDGRVHASSFSLAGTETADGNATEDVERVQALATALFQEQKLAVSALDGKQTNDLVEIRIKNELYRAKVGAMPENATNRGSGYVVLSSVTQALTPSTVVRNGVIIFGLVLLLLGLACSVVIARHFMGGLDEAELGVSEVINGNMDYTFESKAEEFEGLANALNVLLARLLGRPEPGEEDDAGRQSDVLVIEAPSGTAQEAASLAQEPEEAYLKRLLNDYVNAKRKVGDSVEGIDAQAFVQKIRANEAMLKAKLECKMIRFVAQQQGGKVSLRPVPITLEPAAK